MDFITLEDFDGGTQAYKDWKEASGVRMTNVQLAEEVQSMIGQELDLATPKVEFFMNSLVNFGVITKEQYAEVAIGWEMHLRDQLQDVAKRASLQLKQAQRAAQASAARRIATPQKGIVLPGGRIHQVPEKED